MFNCLLDQDSNFLKSATYVQHLPRAFTKSQEWFLKFNSEENVSSKQHENRRKWILISNKLLYCGYKSLKSKQWTKTGHNFIEKGKPKTSSKNTPAVVEINTKNHCNKHVKTKQTTLPLLLPCLSLFLVNNISVKSQIYDSCTSAIRRARKSDCLEILETRLLMLKNQTEKNPNLST